MPMNDVWRFCALLLMVGEIRLSTSIKAGHTPRPQHAGQNTRPSCVAYDIAVPLVSQYCCITARSICSFSFGDNSLNSLS